MALLALLRQAIEIGRRASERPNTPEDPTSLAAVQAETVLQAIIYYIVSFC